MSKSFVNAPDWKKVEEYTTKILELFESSDLTYLDKDNVLSLVKSIVTREFNIIGVMNFIQTIASKEEEEEKKKLAQLYS